MTTITMRHRYSSAVKCELAAFVRNVPNPTLDYLPDRSVKLSEETIHNFRIAVPQITEGLEIDKKCREYPNNYLISKTSHKNYEKLIKKIVNNVLYVQHAFKSYICGNHASAIYHHGDTEDIVMDLCYILLPLATNYEQITKFVACCIGVEQGEVVIPHIDQITNISPKPSEEYIIKIISKVIYHHPDLELITDGNCLVPTDDTFHRYLKFYTSNFTFKWSGINWGGMCCNSLRSNFAVKYHGLGPDIWMDKIEESVINVVEITLFAMEGYKNLFISAIDDAIEFNRDFVTILKSIDLDKAFVDLTRPDGSPITLESLYEAAAKIKMSASHGDFNMVF